MVGVNVHSGLQGRDRKRGLTPRRARVLAAIFGGTEPTVAGERTLLALADGGEL